jgi:hypothetical protein
VLESGDHATALAASPSPGLEIPATLHASLIARFDRLGPTAREVQGHAVGARDDLVDGLPATTSRKGQVLFEIDSPDLSTAEGTLIQAAVEMESA